jgi:hypothetical protein
VRTVTEADLHLEKNILDRLERPTNQSTTMHVQKEGGTFVVLSGRSRYEVLSDNCQCHYPIMWALPCPHLICAHIMFSRHFPVFFVHPRWLAKESVTRFPMLTFPDVDNCDEEVSMDAQMEESGPDPEDDNEVQDLLITLADRESDSDSDDPGNDMDREFETSLLSSRAPMPGNHAAGICVSWF